MISWSFIIKRGGGDLPPTLEAMTFWCHGTSPYRFMALARSHRHLGVLKGHGFGGVGGLGAARFVVVGLRLLYFFLGVKVPNIIWNSSLCSFKFFLIWMFPVSIEKCWKQCMFLGRSWGSGARRWTTRISEAAGDQVGCSLDSFPTLDEKWQHWKGNVGKYEYIIIVSYRFYMQNMETFQLNWAI